MPVFFLGVFKESPCVASLRPYVGEPPVLPSLLWFHWVWLFPYLLAPDDLSGCTEAVTDCRGAPSGGALTDSKPA